MLACAFHVTPPTVKVPHNHRPHAGYTPHTIGPRPKAYSAALALQRDLSPSLGHRCRAAGHAALRSVQLGECEAGVLEAVSLLLLPSVGLSFAVAGMTSARGRSHTFDARADGRAGGRCWTRLARLRLGPEHKLCVTVIDHPPVTEEGNHSPPSS